MIVALLLLVMGRLRAAQLGEVFRRTFHQMWGALLVGVFIFGLAYTFNYSGMAASLAKGFASMGTAFIIVAPILGFIGVALSGSNTSTNAMFGKFQALVGAQLGMPPLLLPTLNSVGAEIGKPIAPQTASVGVSTSKFVRKEGDVIRHNMGWTFILLAYLIVDRGRFLPVVAGGDDAAAGGDAISGDAVSVAAAAAGRRLAAKARAAARGDQNALMPVSSRPMVSWWIVSVPS